MSKHLKKHYEKKVLVMWFEETNFGILDSRYKGLVVKPASSGKFDPGISLPKKGRQIEVLSS
jgi:hypothetical protein